MTNERMSISDQMGSLTLEESMIVVNIVRWNKPEHWRLPHNWRWQFGEYWPWPKKITDDQPAVACKHDDRLSPPEYDIANDRYFVRCLDCRCDFDAKTGQMIRKPVVKPPSAEQVNQMFAAIDASRHPKA